MERRASLRCPVCQGPTKQDEERPDGFRCRNSICTYNHEGVTCPRCQSTDLAVVEAQDQGFLYTCSDCQKKWDMG